jgi:tetratricopeptide (TPR) repeat protein
MSGRDATLRKIGAVFALANVTDPCSVYKFEHYNDDEFNKFFVHFFEQAWQRFAEAIDEQKVTFKGKNIHSAERARLEGNKHFSSGNYNQALLSYNDALRLVPFPSAKGGGSSQNAKTTLAVVFGNRSAVLFRLERHAEAIRDVDNAIIFGYPLQSAGKLFARKIEALLAARRPDLASDAVTLASKFSIQVEDDLKKRVNDKLTKWNGKAKPSLRFMYPDGFDMKQKVRELTQSKSDSDYPFVSSAMELKPVKGRLGDSMLFHASRDIKAGE